MPQNPPWRVRIVYLANDVDIAGKILKLALSQNEEHASMAEEFTKDAIIKLKQAIHTYETTSQEAQKETEYPLTFISRRFSS